MALLESLESTRLQLLELVDPLSDEALLAPNAVNGRSVRDLLVLITVWEAELVTGLMKLNDNRKPTRLLDALTQPVQYEATRLAENEGRDLDRVFNDLVGVYWQLERWIEAFNDDALTQPQRFKWLKEPLGRLIKRTSIDREAAYLKDLAAYAATRSDDHDLPGDFIPLHEI